MRIGERTRKDGSVRDAESGIVAWMRSPSRMTSGRRFVVTAFPAEVNRCSSRGRQRSAPTLARAQRAADIADVEDLGGRSTAAFEGANPRLTSQLDRIDQLAGTQVDVPAITPGAVSAGAITAGRNWLSWRIM